MLPYRRMMGLFAVTLLVAFAGACSTTSSARWDWRGVPTSEKEKRALRKAREKHEPKRCLNDGNWEESLQSGGDEDSPVSGTSGNELPEPLILAHSVDFQVFCGREVPGLDGNYHDGEAHPGQTKEDGDIRTMLGTAVDTGRLPEQFAPDDEQDAKLDEDRRDLYRVVLRHQCFEQTTFNAATHYPTYDWCKRRTRPEEMPSRSRVKSLVEEHLPDRTFEQKNFLFMFDRGARMRQKVVEAFETFEKNFPIVKKIYVDAPRQALERYEKLRKKHASVYETLSPVTTALENGEAPPNGCGSTLEKLQNELAQKLGVEPTTEAVHAFRANHPTGRQLTEALAYCYSRDEHAEERFLLEKELLEKDPDWFYDRHGFQTSQEKERQGPRVEPARITKLQHMAAARQAAFDNHKSDAKLPEFLKDQSQVPDLEREWLAEPRPTIEYQPERDRDRRQIARGYANGEYELDEGIPAPVIQSITKVPVGYQLGFPMETRVVKNETCDKWKKLDTIDHVEYVGGRQKVVYDKRCLESSVKKGEIEEGFEPVVIADWEGELLEEGMRAYVRSNRTDPKDAVLVDAWWPDRDEPVVLQGVKVAH